MSSNPEQAPKIPESPSLGFDPVVEAKLRMSAKEKTKTRIVQTKLKNQALTEAQKLEFTPSDLSALQKSAMKAGTIESIGQSITAIEANIAEARKEIDSLDAAKNPDKLKDLAEEIATYEKELEIWQGRKPEVRLQIQKEKRHQEIVEAAKVRVAKTIAELYTPKTKIEETEPELFLTPPDLEESDQETFQTPKGLEAEDEEEETFRTPPDLEETEEEMKIGDYDIPKRGNFLPKTGNDNVSIPRFDGRVVDVKIPTRTQDKIVDSDYDALVPIEENPNIGPAPKFSPRVDQPEHEQADGTWETEQIVPYKESLKQISDDSGAWEETEEPIPEINPLPRSFPMFRKWGKTALLAVAGVVGLVAGFFGPKQHQEKNSADEARAAATAYAETVSKGSASEKARTFVAGEEVTLDSGQKVQIKEISAQRMYRELPEQIKNKNRNLDENYYNQVDANHDMYLINASRSDKEITPPMVYEAMLRVMKFNGEKSGVYFELPKGYNHTDLSLDKENVRHFLRTGPEGSVTKEEALASSERIDAFKKRDGAYAGDDKEDTTLWDNSKLGTPQSIQINPDSTPEGAAPIWGETLNQEKVQIEVGKNLEILTSFFIEHPDKVVTRKQAEKAYTNLVDLVGTVKARETLASISKLTNKEKSIKKAIETFSSELES